MKKVLIVGLMVVCILLTGCTNDKDTFKHYDLKDKDLNTYVYYSDTRGKEIYVLSDISSPNAESFLTGLFYKVSENDYILLDTLEFNQKDSYKNNNVYQFYDNKLYGVGNGDSPMVFEVELKGKESKRKEIKYQVNGKINPFLITSIKEINNDEISYYGYATINEVNSSALIKCSISKYECNINAY